MRENIYTIPINEAFENPCGCPLCRLESKLSRDALEYVMGAAMMEPDVRLETNRLGFCRAHLDEMLGMKNRLGLSLILQTHLEEVRKKGLPKGGLLGKPDCASAAKQLRKTEESCFVCRRVSEFMEHYYSNLLHMWEESDEFRRKFDGAEYICLHHLTELLERGASALGKKRQAEFTEHAVALAAAHFDRLQADVDTFCRSFEYQNAGKPMTEGEKRAAERIADALTGAVIEA